MKLCDDFILGRFEAKKAGSRHSLLIENLQEVDFGSYMCFASNSMGSAQKIIEIAQEDKDNNENKSGKFEKYGRDRNYKILNKNLQRDRKALIKFRMKMEKEIESIKSELSFKEGRLKSVKMEDSFEKAILSDLGTFRLFSMK